MQNGATGTRYTAVRGKGAHARRRAARAIRHDRASSGRSIGLSGWPADAARRGGSSGPSAPPRSSLCDVAAGHLDGYVDGVRDSTRRGTTSAALLVCREAGAAIVDAAGDDLEVADADARRQLVAAGTTELLGVLRDAVAP